MCDRCQARDGRATKTYELVNKRAKRELCDKCAVFTAEVHELKPNPNAPSAPATPPPSAAVEEKPKKKEA